ncbi:MAG TPA: hypothetical protein VH186_24670 [Chloroflexia bacterium]|nr:hypothetical protein [Chloroflexia bacterium]
MNSRMEHSGRKKCPNCGLSNAPDAETCARCDLPLSENTAGANEGTQRGGRLSLNPDEVAKPSSSASSGGGGRLSRLAEARRKKEAESGHATDSGSDWLGSLRSDAPLPLDYSTGMSEEDDVDESMSAALQQLRVEEGVEPATEAPAPFDSVGPASFETSETGASSPPMPDLSASAEETNPALGEFADESLPDWLRNMHSGQSSPATPIHEEPPSGSPDSRPDLNDASLPDWLRQLGNSPEAPQPASEELYPEAPLIGFAGGNDTTDLPDWLREMNQSPGSEAKPSSGGAGPDDIPAWLRSTTDSLPVPSHPTFGDVDVEQKLRFAFDEPPERSEQSNPDLSENANISPISGGRAHTGLTDLLGLPPADPNEEVSAELPDLPPFLFDEEVITGGGNEHTGLPELPDFLMSDLPPLEADSAENNPDFNSPLRPWLEGLQPPVMEPETFALPDIAFEAGQPAHEVANLQELSADTTELRPWLQGLEPPVLEPATQTAPAITPFASEAATGAPAEALAEENPLIGSAELPTDTTRSFSMRDMLSSTGSLPPNYTDSLNQPYQEPALSFDQGSVAAQEGPAADVGEDLPPWLAFAASTETPSAKAAPQPFSFEPEETIQGEMLPFVPPPFEGIEVKGEEGGEHLSLSQVTGEQQPEIEFNDFLNEPASSSVEPVRNEPYTPVENTSLPRFGATGDLPDFLRDMGMSSGSGTKSAAQPEGQSTSPAPAPQAPFDISSSAAAGTGDIPDFFREPGVNSVPFENAKAEPELPAFFDEAGTTTGREQSGIENSLDFLRDEASGLEATQAEEEELPSWLKSLTGSAAPEASSEPAQPKSGGYSPMMMGVSRADEQHAELPEWLREEPEEASAAQPPVEEVPSWLDQRTSTEETPSWLNQSTSTEEMPSWLSQNQPSQAQPGFEQTSAEPEPAFDFAVPSTHPAEISFDNFLENVEATTPEGNEETSLPEWLRESQGGTNAETDFALPAELPEWLNESTSNEVDLGLDDLIEEKPVEAVSDRPEAASEFNSLLEDVGTSGSGRAIGPNFLSDIDGPAWLRNATQTTRPEQAPPATGPAIPPASLESGATLPGWLRAVAPSQVEEVPTTTELVPSGESETALALPQVTLPPKLASAAVLSTLLAPAVIAPAVVQEVAERRKTVSRGPVLVRYGLYLLLLAVALFGLLRPLTMAPLAIAAPVQNFYDTVAALSPNSKVLIAYDWEADRSGEMLPMSQAVTEHVMSRRARVVNISLNPQGPALASQVTDSLATNPDYGNSNFYQYGHNYLNLGWRPGNEVALRSLFDRMGDLYDYKNNQQAATTPVMQGINSLADFDLIIVLAGDEGSVRTWVEQLGIQPGARLLFGVPSAVEPLARPYAQGLSTASQEIRSTEHQPRAASLLAGLSQTSQYEQLLRDQLNLKTDQRTSLEGRLSAQSLAALLLALIVIGVNVYFFVRKRRE